MGDAHFKDGDECRTCKRLTFPRKQIFIRRMISQGHQPEIIVDCVYAGGNCHGKNGEKMNHNNYYERNYRQIFNRPEYKHNCLCGQTITNQCYLYNKRTKIAYVIGNECVDRFANGKTCFNCNIKHRNIKTKYCNICRYFYEAKR